MKLLLLCFITLISATCFDEQLDLLYQASPQAQFYLDILAQSPTTRTCTEQEIIAGRPFLDQFVQFLSPPTGLTSVQRVPLTIKGGQTVNAYWVWDSTKDLVQLRQESTVMYTHGGAWVSGSFTGYRGAVDRIALELNSAVFFVDYRLAPEVRLPNQLDELVNGYKYILNSGVSKKKLMLAGESAGGHLSALLVQTLIAKNDPLPSCLALISPKLDLEVKFESYFTRKWSDIFLKSNDDTFLPAFVLDNTTYITDPKVSPFQGSWEKFPPTLFTAGSEETLLSDSFQGSTKLVAQGGVAKVYIAANMPHAYTLFGEVPEGQLGRAYIKRWFDSNK